MSATALTSAAETHRRRNSLSPHAHLGHPCTACACCHCYCHCYCYCYAPCPVTHTQQASGHGKPAFPGLCQVKYWLTTKVDLAGLPTVTSPHVVPEHRLGKHVVTLVFCFLQGSHAEPVLQCQSSADSFSAELFQSAPGHMDPADHELTTVQLSSGTIWLPTHWHAPTECQKANNSTLPPQKDRAPLKTE